MCWKTNLFYCFISTLTIQSVNSQEIFGNIYQISEPDALLEIQERGSKVDYEEIYKSKPQSEWSAFKGKTLPRALKTQTREFIPLYESQFDVTDERGTVIYPKGFIFNPLEHISMPMRLLILDETDSDWLVAHVQPNDVVILTRGNYQELSKLIDRPVFLLEEKFVERFGLQGVPVIVKQVGTKYLLSEFNYVPDEEKLTDEN